MQHSWGRARWPTKIPSNLNRSVTDSVILNKGCTEIPRWKTWWASAIHIRIGTRYTSPGNDPLKIYLLSAKAAFLPAGNGGNVPTTSLLTLHLHYMTLPWSPGKDVGIGVECCAQFWRDIFQNKTCLKDSNYTLEWRTQKLSVLIHLLIWFKDYMNTSPAPSS